MKNFKEMNFTELSATEMKQIKGGDWIDDLLKVLGSVEAVAAYLGKSVEEVRKLLGL